MNSQEIIYHEVDSGFILGVKRLIQEFFNKRQLFVVLLWTALSKRYRGSYIGLFWTLLNPFFHMLSLALIFPLIIRFRMENYILYLFSGILAWSMISTSVIGGSESILTYRSFIRKVYVPKIIFPIVTISVELINTFAAIIILHLIALAFHFHIHTNLLYLAAALALTFLFSVAVASITSVLTVYFRDIRYILGVVMQPLFYLSAIIFPVSVLPEKYRYLIEFNIFYQFVRLFHQAIYFGHQAEWLYFAKPFFLMCFLFSIALYIHQKYDRRLVYRV
ncbi:ABC transporter permease [Legionella israelensis]|uniref:Transport permease protein n=1 Tax=Legionella israelensis TaxID=454 RepID=A0A0W0WNS3_9GAMM|nr:ABC transporter permease [Legionella israelensis]KTD33977.1 polysaccharide ABC transporter, permease protein [Legionella israelensis]QBS10687.1 ABC transporter permease [Legionella israelensis]SCX83692.1 ABC-2 type transport system permease protein [Legionella israelensis DSM 19235]STX57643.1 polysaccharide ABC transporter, permease protein [Legionella israelensis]